MSHRARVTATSILAAVLVVACGGQTSPTGSPITAGPSRSPGTPSSTPAGVSAAPTSVIPASPAASILALLPTDDHRTLASATYRVDGFAVPVSLTLPAGWVTNGFKRHDLVLAKDNAFLALVVMRSVYHDPCHTERAPAPVEPGVDNLVRAFTEMVGFRITGLRDARIAGATGKSFALANNIDTNASNCSSRDVVWIGRDGDDEPVLETPGGSDQLWVVDVSGTTVLIGGPEPVVDAISFGGVPG